jgi:O-antigen/teichoic acid export membrane protein
MQRRMRMRENLLKNFMKFSYGSWVGLLLGIVSTMLITRILSPNVLGKASMYDLFIQVSLIVTIFGTDQAFSRFYYEEKNNKRGALLYKTLRIPLLASICVITFVFIFGKEITTFLFGKESLALTLLICAGIFAQLVIRFGLLVLRMDKQGNLYSLLQIFVKFFEVVFIITFFYFIGPIFEILVYSKVITTIIVFLIALYFGKSFWSIKNINIKNTRHSQKDILVFGTPFVFTIFITWLFEAFDKIAIRQWSSFEELGMYTAAMRLVALVTILRSTFSVFWTPVSYEKFERNPNDKEFFRVITIFVSFAMFFVGIVSIATKDLIVYILGDQYKDASLIMPFLIYMPIFYAISETTVIGINFYKKVKWHLIIAAIVCGINILGNWILVPNHGATGAAVATGISYIIFFTLRTVVSLKFYNVNYPLKRIYFMILVTLVYSFLSINFNYNWLNILSCLISLSFLWSLYRKDIGYYFKNRSKFRG